MTAAIKNMEPVASAESTSMRPSDEPNVDPHYRRQAALVALGRRAIAPPATDLLVQDAAALIAETLETDHCGAAELDAAGNKLTLRLARVGSRGSESNQFAEHEANLDQQTSLAAHAIQAAQVVVVPDLAADSPVRDQFLYDQGIRSALIVPLQMVDQSYGALGAFSIRPRKFTPEDMLFAETIAHLVSTTISRDRTQKVLDDERRFNKTLLATVDAIVLILDPNGRIVSINSAGERTTGFATADFAHRSIWNTLLVHNEVATFRAAFERVHNASKMEEYESFVLTKSGERRWIRWNLAATRNPAGTVESIVGTGIDITEQRIAEETLSRLEAGAPQSAEADGPPTTLAPFRPRPVSRNGERRKRPRRSFNYLQRIAPIIDGKLPEQDSFKVVACRDISSDGFSFVSSNPTAHALFVVALGTPPVVIYLTAKVAHVTAFKFNGDTRYLIGCQYVGKSDYAAKSQGGASEAARALTARRSDA